MNSYRLMLIGMGSLAAVAIVETFFGWLPYTPLSLGISVLILLFSARTTSALCALFTKSRPNPESSYITALLLFFILAPIQSAHDALVLLVASAISVLSKYIFAFRNTHFFNPAAFAALVVSIIWVGAANWWSADLSLLPFTLILAFLVVRKTRQFDVFWGFIGAAYLFFALRLLFTHTFISIDFLRYILQFSYLTPLVFVAAFMITDPQTMPHRKQARRICAWIVGALFTASFGWITISPQIALLVGNAFAFLAEKRKYQKYELSLRSVTPLTREVFEFVFLPSRRFPFKPGQYMEWTLPHTSPDGRGIRRYFSLTSSPEDPFIRFSTTLPIEKSTFKDALQSLQPGTLTASIISRPIFASNIAGEFVLPENPNTKLLMLVSGIGIAPCMSMFRHLAKNHERRDMVLIYSAVSAADFIYQEEINSLKESIGLHVRYLPIDFLELSDWEGDSGHVTAEYIQKKVPDYKERHWMLSGSQGLVQEFRWISQAMHIPKSSVTFEFS